MTTALHRRLPNEINLLAREKDSLESRGIYVHVDDSDMRRIEVLVVPKHRVDADDPSLVSPYTGGFFLFEIGIGDDYPIEPPRITFHPQQRHVRLHPNLYESGKVCLSIINTWGAKDWTPTMSLLALINTLEVRFSERGLCFEPAQENAKLESIRAFNDTAEYGKLQWVVLPVASGGAARHSSYDHFNEQIATEFRHHFDFYMERINALCSARGGTAVAQPVYQHRISFDARGQQDLVAALSELQ